MSFKQAKVSAWLGIICVLVKAAAVACFVAAYSQQTASGSGPRLLIIGLGLAADLTGTVGLGFAIYATFRKQWRWALVAGWLLNLIGMSVQPLVNST